MGYPVYRYDDASLNDNFDVDIPDLSPFSDDASSLEDEIGSKPVQTNKAKSDFFTDLLDTCLKSLICFDNMCGSQTYACSTVVDSVEMSMPVRDYVFDRDSDDLDYNSCSAAMKEVCTSNSQSSPTRSTTIGEKLSDTYTNGIYSFISNDKLKPRTPRNTMQQMVPGDFISGEEELYASSWNGHLPLVPMSDAEAAIERKSSRRRNSLVARGKWNYSCSRCA